MSTLLYLVCMLVIITPSIGNVEIDPKLLEAIAKVESNNDVCAIDKNKEAYGIYQITKPYWDDALEFDPLLCEEGPFPNNVFGIGSEEFATMVVESYICRYATEERLGHQPTNEDIARIHKGGPDGYMNGITEGFWDEVESAYDDICQNGSSNATECAFPCNNNECCGSTGCECLNSSGSLMPC